MMETKKNFNNTYFYETEILMYLYKKKEVSTLEIEKLFGGDNEKQAVNNVISDSDRNTSLIKRGYLDYDKNNQVLTITAKGRTKIKKMFSERRSNKTK